MMSALLTLTLLAAPCVVPQDSDLPPAAALVDEALTACREADVKDDLFVTPSLMAALFDIGREEKARRLAFDAKGEIFRPAMIAFYVSIVTERTGTPPDIDTLLANGPESARDSVYATVARELAESNRPAEAETFYERIPEGRGSRLFRMNAAVPLIESFLRARDREGAGRIARAGLEAGSGLAVRFAASDQFDPLAAAAVELGEVDALRVVLEEAHVAAENAAEPSKYPTVALSRVGRWRAATGDRTGAERAFDAAAQIARRIAADASEGPEELRRRLRRDEAREAYVALAANERIAGFPDRADKSLDAFLRLASEGEPASGSEDYELFNAAKTCLAAGDRDGADRLIAEIESPYYRVHVRIDATELLLDAGDAEAARKFLVEAADEFERAGDKVNTPETEGETNRISLLTEMADMHRRLGDDAAATDLHRRASELLGDRAGHLQWLARAQVRAGSLAEAYATIRRMPPDHKYRVWPLVELAAAAAKREADRADAD